MGDVAEEVSGATERSPRLGTCKQLAAVPGCPPLFRSSD